MDTMSVITKQLTLLGYKPQEIEVRFTDQGDIVIYLLVNSMLKRADEVYEYIWGQLKARLKPEDFNKIVGVYLETTDEKVRRCTLSSDKLGIDHMIWKHFTFSGIRYWLLIDAVKSGDEYHSIYFVFMYSNSKGDIDFHEGMQYIYKKEIVDFMGFKGKHDEFIEYLLEEVFNIGKNVIQFNLMGQYERMMKESRVFGDSNPFHYAFKDIEIKPVDRLELDMNNIEMEYFTKLQNQFDGYSLINILKQSINAFQDMMKYRIASSINM